MLETARQRSSSGEMLENIMSGISAHGKEDARMASIGWLVSFLVFLGVELGFRCLTSLWFAAGAFGAFVAALAGLSMEAQLACFVAVSFLTLILIRPAAFFISRYVTGRNRKGRWTQ